MALILLAVGCASETPAGQFEATFPPTAPSVIAVEPTGTAGHREPAVDPDTPGATTITRETTRSGPGHTPAADPTGAPGTTPTSLPALDGPRLGTLRLEPVAATRMFRSPTNMVQATDGNFWVTEQEGRVWVMGGLATGGDGVALALDITDRVSSRRTEEGLLGLAFDPANARHLYVYYSASRPRRSVVSRFTVTPDGGSVDSASELVILEVQQPYANHNGGQLAFGPDGYLYIGLGDGGSAGDPQANGQDTSTLLGSILRIDVAGSMPGQPYDIPGENPFAGGGGRGEIWAYGLRNPWRFSFDRETGELWAGDVGQNSWEEIDLIERGGNYGWNVLEGNHCFRPKNECDASGKIPPVWEYSLDGEPCSVIGGYVYRGGAIPRLTGAYVYGDFCSGEIFGLRYSDGEVQEHKRLADADVGIMSFAEGYDGELYLLSQRAGIYRLISQ